MLSNFQSFLVKKKKIFFYFPACRIAEMSDEIRRLRPPRRFHNDLIIRPYNHQEAEGYAILQVMKDI